MESYISDIQSLTPDSSLNETKKKCLTISEYNAMINWIDSLISDNTDFILNKFELLTKKTLNEYSHLHQNTVLSIVDARVQHYVRQRHHRVFNNNSNINSHMRSSATVLKSSTPIPNQSPNHQQQRSKRLSNTTNIIYERYKELVANNSVASPLTTLANNLRMPAMLVAKIVLADQVHEERQREQLNRQQDLNNEDSLNSSILNDSCSILTDNNDSSTILTQESCANNSETIELDTSSNIDSQLSQQLNWLTSKLISMYDVPDEILNQSANSSVNSSSNSLSVANKKLNLTPHQLATSTWLIRSDPQLAYQVYKCSVIDGHYGSCVEFIKSCTGKRYEQYLEQNMACLTVDAKSQKNRLLYKTEKECRLRGLDMTPDMVLNEPIAVLLSEDQNTACNQEYMATNYVGGSDNAVRVLNWIESKAMFGGPEQLRTVMQRQLFPYWNRYGPGAVIYWFGHILEDCEKNQSVHIGVSTNKPTIDTVSNTSVNISAQADSTETSFNFWSKYCLLMDGFPSPDKIIMHNHRNYNRQNNLKKKISGTMTV